MLDEFDSEQILQDGEEYLTIKRAAELYGVSGNTIRNWIDKKFLSLNHTGYSKRPVYVKRSEMDKMMEYHPAPDVRRVSVTFELDEALLAQVQALASGSDRMRAIVEAGLRLWLEQQLTNKPKAE